MQPPRQAAPATPPQEGMVCSYGMLKKYHYAPVEGNCLVQNHHNHPVRLRLPPLHRRGIAGCRYDATTPSDRTAVCFSSTNSVTFCRYDATTPSGCACHPSTGGEWSGTIFVQIRCNHPVRLRLPPLHRRGMVCPYGIWNTFSTAPTSTAPRHPIHANHNSPPVERRCLVQIHWGCGLVSARSSLKP